MTFDYTDRRQYERIEVVQAIFIEVVGRGSRKESDNPILRCETVDISVGGLKVFVPEKIAAGSQLNLAVPMDDWKENLELRGEAKWSRPADGRAGYWVGLELMDASREDMERWCRIAHSLAPRVRPGEA
ncbi:PilZ domain-containing protein [Pseudohalioglobus lutimaris]|uniref:PilZ domain-containing protein n=1 Tax=Pseudohalioglobus lutimaris TaxID=1737061 RepID=A0A2N5WYL6_9GAMM|nr:PilZ domain-containing protein [Pseudohalioglobus lutimaris]PLW67298.1 PilZ domain-containing protein [Pseudohalioglobus lutimaris]